MTFTPQFFDTLVIAVILIGLALAGVRFYRDMTRPPIADKRAMPTSIPPQADDAARNADTKPKRP